MIITLIQLRLTKTSDNFYNIRFGLLESDDFTGGTSVVVPYCSCCLYLYFGSAIMLVTYFVNFR